MATLRGTSSSTSLPCLRAIILLTLLTSGCAIFEIDTMHNQPLTSGPQKTRATETVSKGELYNGKFIGIALSGGGSRAANFSAAVLLELDDKLQLLGKATALSSVSGGSLPAAYYGLYGHDPGKWREDELRRQMKKDFEARWIWRWFLPQNAFLYWTTNFSRSDIMTEVLDSNLYHGKTFANMSSGRTHILINSTSLSRGGHFIFSQETFADKLKARIDTYPVANAVMASSAFPGAFHDMTLRNYSSSQGAHGEKEYEHLIDGGPFDNLGVNTLLETAYKVPELRRPPACCFLFIVDAYPYPIEPRHVHDADTRSFIDYFVDSNLMAASDTLLAVQRSYILNMLNVSVYDDDWQIDDFFHNQPAKEQIDLDTERRIYCHVWHISLQRLLSPVFQKYVADGDADLARIAELASIVNSIPTRYKLTGQDTDGKDISPDKLQDYLFTAARYLVNYDRDESGNQILKQVRDWLDQ